MKQTAVEWLIEQMIERKYFAYAVPLSYTTLEHLVNQAKAMEKDEVHNAWDDGYDKGTRDRIEKISNPVGNAEQYYNKTFKSE